MQAVINDTALLRLAAEFIPYADQLASTPAPFAGDSHLFDSDDQYAQWLFALDALNFSFWPDDGRDRWYWPHELTTSHSGECPTDCTPSTGAIALGNAFRHAMRRVSRLAVASLLKLLTLDSHDTHKFNQPSSLCSPVDNVSRSIRGQNHESDKVHGLKLPHSKRRDFSFSNR